jgi:hypothetical protein
MSPDVKLVASRFVSNISISSKAQGFKATTNPTLPFPSLRCFNFNGIDKAPRSSYQLPHRLLKASQLPLAMTRSDYLFITQFPIAMHYCHGDY